MKVCGLVHVHSSFSFDGKLSLKQLHDLAHSNGCQFVLLTEHIETLKRSDLEKLIAECEQQSDENCLLIPGLEIEDQCLLFLGMTMPVDTTDYEGTRDQLIKSGVFVVLAHPHRCKRAFSLPELKGIDAIEVWNVKDDGFRAPGYVGWKLWNQTRNSTELQPAAIAGLDFHSMENYRPLVIEVEVSSLTLGSIMERLHQREFLIRRAGKIFNPGAVTKWQRLIGLLTWMMRCLYAKLRGKHQLVPFALRKHIKKAIKG